MITQKISPDKVFRVDKKIVIISSLKSISILEIVFLLLKDNFRIMITLKDEQFWIITLIAFMLIFLIDLWTILYDRIEFKGTTITSYFNSTNSGEILDFVSVKQKKTPYTNYLGFEYRQPKGIHMRYLLPYGHYNPKALQAIMQEILKINPNIKLEDDLSKQILDGTYENKNK